jgi:hypothetical protein
MEKRLILFPERISGWLFQPDLLALAAILIGILFYHSRQQRKEWAALDLHQFPVPSMAFPFIGVV